MTPFLILAPFATLATHMMATSIKITLVASVVVALSMLGWDISQGRPVRAEIAAHEISAKLA